MTKTITTTDISTRLDKIKVPPLTVEALDAILNHEGQAFITALDALICESPGWEKKQEYVSAVLAGSVANTRNALYNVFGRIYPITDLIEISKEEGRAFRVAVKALIDAPNNAQDETLYLSRVLGGLLPSFSPRLSNEIGRGTPPALPQECKPSKGASAPATSAKQKPIFRSSHIYGKSGAICVSEDTALSSGAPTVRFEGALSSNGSYRWEQKENFQCTVGEMTLIVGLLLGYADEVTLSGHGKRHEKSLSLSKQGHKVLINLTVRGGQSIMVPALDVDLVLPMGILLSQMKKNFPDLSDRMLEQIIRQTCKRRSEMNHPEA